MTALGVAAAWIAISIVGAKGLILFARAAASNQFEADQGPAVGESGVGREHGSWISTPGHAQGTQL